MIHVEGLWKSYGGRPALSGVTFAAADGAITGLLGANGAGKTTTFSVIGGLMRPDRGRAAVDGAGDGGPAAAIGVLPHVHGLYARLTVREHVEYFGALRGLRGGRLRDAVQAALSRFALSTLAGRRTEALSQGERVRVALAGSMVHRPRHVVLDEPTSGLDVMSVRALHDDVRRLRDDGICVLFSTHVMSEAAALCDCVAILAHGRVVAEGPPAELVQRAGRDGLEDVLVELSAAAAPGAREEGMDGDVNGRASHGSRP